MIASKLKLIISFIGLIVILSCAWTKGLDTNAMQRVDEGFKRASVSFATARLIGAVISVAQSVDIGIGVKVGLGQALQPIGDLVAKFGDLMFAATVAFGAMKVLLAISESAWSSWAVTGATLGWFWCYWRRHLSPIWLSKLAVVLLLVRFAVPIAMVGSDKVFQTFMAKDYKTSKSELDATPSKLQQGLWGLVDGNNDSGPLSPLKLPTINGVKNTITSMAQHGKEAVDHMIQLIVVFLLQTLVIPLLFFGVLYRLLTAMFQISETKTDEESHLITR